MARRKGRLTTNASNLTPNEFPTATILPFAGQIAPDGWILCDGSTVSRTTYAALYAELGDAYGQGDGSTTFHLPDLRGRFARGSDDMGTGAASRDVYTRGASATGGNTSGRGSAQDDTSRRPRGSNFTTNTSGNHNHTYRDSIGTGASITNGNGFTTSNTTPIDNQTKNIFSAGNHSHSITGGGDSETTVKNVAVNYIIKI